MVPAIGTERDSAPVNDPVGDDPDVGTRRNPLWRSIQGTLQVLFPLWFRYRAEGVHHIPRHGGGLVLANHQSFLDPMLIGLPLRRPVNYMARRNLFRVPVVGWILKNTYVFPVDRERPTPTTIRTAIERMSAGHLVGVFPEGTRSSDANVAEFKPGFATLLRRTQLPIYPVGITGANRAYPSGQKFPRPRSIRVRFGAAIPHAEYAEYLTRGREPELAAFARERVTALVDS